MTKPLIPFGYLPGHWGLRGETRELARIDYELDTVYERDVARAKVLFKHSDTLNDELLKIDLRHQKITQKEYDLKTVENIADEQVKTRKTLDILLAAGDITQQEYEKEVATNEGLPWFHFDVDYVSGELELSVDWNSAYIEFLRTMGYGNNTDTDDEVIDEYVRDFGRKLSSEPSIEEYQEQLGNSFVKAHQEADGSVSYQ